MTEATHPEITAIILAGGRGSRMGGADKGLQNFRGIPFAMHALMRLQMQSGGLIFETMINANRNLSAYEAMGVAVWPDASPDEFAGPLAGFLTGLERCETPYLLTVPCDSPLFPLDLAQRMMTALQENEADIAVACAPEIGADPAHSTRPQPVFSLIKSELLESLAAFLQGGGRKIDAWTAQHRVALARFDLPGDSSEAFMNVNTLQELHRLQSA